MEYVIGGFLIVSWFAKVGASSHANALTVAVIVFVVCASSLHSTLAGLGAGLGAYLCLAKA